jgi:heterodisulfide reductase subunit A
MKENVVIIGAGIAGLEAAASLRQLGYNPILIEKQDHVGGHVASWHKLFPDYADSGDIIDSLKKRTADVKIYLSTGISFINRLKNGFVVMLSTGEPLLCTALLFATGFSLFDATKKEEYGYGIYDRVVTNADLEHWFNTGDDPRIPSGINSIGFVHCVGSRDVKAGNPQCSKVCCITAVKQAIEIKEKFPEAEAYCFYMDLRMFGKKYEDFYIGAQQDHGVHFIRGRVSEVCETLDGRVQVKAEDTLSGKPVKVSLDLLVLMSGIVCNPDAAALAKEISVPLDSEGFLKSRDNTTGITAAPKKGVFYAGACTSPKTVPETISEARNAALEIDSYIKGGK